MVVSPTYMEQKLTMILWLTCSMKKGQTILSKVSINLTFFIFICDIVIGKFYNTCTTFCFANGHFKRRLIFNYAIICTSKFRPKPLILFQSILTNINSKQYLETFIILLSAMFSQNDIMNHTIYKKGCTAIFFHKKAVVLW